LHENCSRNGKMRRSSFKLFLPRVRFLLLIPVEGRTMPGPMATAE
jgi:hypothetical protein